jgi:uncharacterized protein (DUF58 family)
MMDIHLSSSVLLLLALLSLLLLLLLAVVLLPVTSLLSAALSLSPDSTRAGLTEEARACVDHCLPSAGRRSLCLALHKD